MDVIIAKSRTSWYEMISIYCDLLMIMVNKTNNYHSHYLHHSSSQLWYS